MLKKKYGLKAVAAIEASKGIISLLVGLGLHQLAGRNVQQVLESLAMHFHLNPASHLPGIIDREAHFLTNSDLTLIAAGALVYAAVRLVEAYGLWNELVWTEWFALLSGAIYIPFEVYEVLSNTGTMSILVLMVNLLVVFYMYTVVRDKPNKTPE